MVVTIKDEVTSEYPTLLSAFDYAVNVGRKHHMVLRPTESKNTIDDEDDVFDYYDDLTSTWILTKGYDYQGKIQTLKKSLTFSFHLVVRSFAQAVLDSKWEGINKNMDLRHVRLLGEADKSTSSPILYALKSHVF